MTSQTLLIELLCEELPPNALQRLSDAFAKHMADQLCQVGLRESAAPYTTFATPRRLAVRLADVLDQQPQRSLEKKGPALERAFDANGHPSAALRGFARSCQVPIEALVQKTEGKHRFFIFLYTEKGATLTAQLGEIIDRAMKRLPASKWMRWGSEPIPFVRPLRGILVLYGDQLLPIQVRGLVARRFTRGHRVLAPFDLVLDHADHYARQLYEHGKVIASFPARRAFIADQLDRAAAHQNAQRLLDDDLLNEVTSLVEWPVIYTGRFDAAFLTIPQACLMLSMRQHQRYFPLLDHDGRLLPVFLCVANLNSPDPHTIISGNERVLRARFSDAHFFYQEDQKHRLETRVPDLAKVVYHHQLGSQLARTERITQLAELIAGLLGIDQKQSARAAWLSKADLITLMVGEFPELQGTMGGIYARLMGEDETVCLAIAAHYQPRFAGDALPQGHVAQTVALADKLDTLTGLFGIGLAPSGEKDPFALRRAALGVLRLLLVLPLDSRVLLKASIATFPPQTLSTETENAVYRFLIERLRHFLAASYPVPHVEAVLALCPSRFNTLTQRLTAVALFQDQPETPAFLAANKRIRNILKKAEPSAVPLDPSMLETPEEQDLYNIVLQTEPTVQTALLHNDIHTALSTLSAFLPVIPPFFEKVCVLCEDSAQRQQRLALLKRVWTVMNGVADFSLLPEVSPQGV